MKLGFIGLGRMGQGMVQLLIDKGHEVVAYDINDEAVQSAVEYGAGGADSLADLVDQLEAPRFVWIMVQRKVVQIVLDELLPLLAAGDTVVDGGNTFYQETLERSAGVEGRGIHYIDVGVSGGVDAARNGACLMVGGDRAVFDQYEQIFADLAQTDGYGYMGNSGAGHLIKGLHNGIEYGMMQAIGDGFEAIMTQKDEFNLDPAAALKVYNHGSIIESNLTKWLHDAWTEDPELSQIAGSVPPGDTTEEMKLLAKLSPNPSLGLAIAEREQSVESPSFSAKAVAAMRHEFGGHPILSTLDADRLPPGEAGRSSVSPGAPSAFSSASPRVEHEDALSSDSRGEMPNSHPASDSGQSSRSPESPSAEDASGGKQ